MAFWRKSRLLKLSYTHVHFALYPLRGFYALPELLSTLWPCSLISLLDAYLLKTRGHTFWESLLPKEVNYKADVARQVKVHWRNLAGQWRCARLSPQTSIWLQPLLAYECHLKEPLFGFFIYIYTHTRMRLQVLEFVSCKLHKKHWKLTDYKCCSSRLTSLLNHYMKIPAIGLVTRVNRGNSRLNQENKWDSLKAGIWQIIFGVFSPQSTCPHQKEKKKKKSSAVFNLRLFSQFSGNS